MMFDIYMYTLYNTNNIIYIYNIYYIMFSRALLGGAPCSRNLTEGLAGRDSVIFAVPGPPMAHWTE